MRHALVMLLSCAVTLPIVPIASGSTLFGLVNTGELYSSDTEGASWSVLSALPVSDAVGLAAGDASTELFLVSETGTFYRSDDAGSN